MRILKVFLNGIVMTTIAKSKAHNKVVLNIFS